MARGYRVRRASTLLVAAITILAVGACGGEDDPSGAATTAPPATTSAPTVESTPIPTPTPEPTVDAPAVDPTTDQGVIAGFIAARDAFRAAYNPPNPEDPGLLAHYDGEALAGTQDELNGLIAKGQSEVIEYGHHPQVIVNDPGGAAVVEDCVEASVRTIDTETGDEVGQPVVETRNTRYTLELREDMWVIVKGERLEGTCTPES